MTARPDDPVASLRAQLMGFRTTQLLHAAATLGVADALAAGPRDAAALAPALRADTGALRRLLRALAALGVCAEDADGRFALTALGQPLRTDVPGSLHPLAMLYGAAWLWRAYGRTAESVRTGRPAFDAEHDAPLYAYLEAHPAAAAVFDAAMGAFSAPEAQAVLAAYDFAGVAGRGGCVADVGGGEGALLAAVLGAHPGLRGVLLERPPVAGRARAALARAGVADRCAVVAGDFFAEVPPGGDVYLLKSVLHNWDDGAAAALLRRCRAAAPEGTLLVVERVVPEPGAAGGGPDGATLEAALFDVNMLVVTGGRERTAREYAALLAGAGYALRRITPTAAVVSVLEAAPA